MNLLKRFFMCVSICLVSVLVLAGCSIAAHNANLSIENDRVMFVGQTYELKVHLEEGDPSKVEWTTDNKEIAQIEGNQITILAEGEFNLVAIYGSERTVKHINAHAIAQYSITYWLNGGKGKDLIKSFDELTESVELVAPTREGYTFRGWFMNPQLNGEPVETISGSIARDVELYAKWNIITYPISYELNGGSCEGLPQERTIEYAEFTLPAAEKEGYNFLGWYDNAEFDGNPVTKLDAKNLAVEKLYAKFSAELYSITYEGNGTLPTGAPFEFSCEQAVTLVPAVREGYEFAGWTLNGEIVTEIPAGTKQNVTLTATWTLVEYPIEYELNGGLLLGLPTSRTIESDPITLGTPAKEGFEFAGWYDNAEFEGDAVTVLDSSNLEITKLYAKFEQNKPVHIGSNDYLTITEALQAAKDGDVITVDAGVYEEELTIAKAVTIEGPEKGVAGSATREAGEAEITGAVTVSAAGVKIDGMKFSGGAYIVVSANNFTLVNSIQACTSYSKAGSTNRNGQLVNSAAISGLTISDNYFSCGKNYCNGCIATEATVSNVVIKGNKFESTYATGSTNECIQLYTIAGTIEVSENDIHFDTTNFVIFMGSYGCSCTKVLIADNYIGKNNDTTSGVSVRNMPAGCELTFIHNEVVGMGGNLLDSKTSNASAVVNVLYNYFEPSFKFTNTGSATVNYEGNCYKVAQTTATSDYQAYDEYDEEDLEVAYQAYLHPTVSYDLDGGEWGEEEGITELTRGVEYVLPTPLKEGYEFLGWFEGETEVTSCLNKSYELKAHWLKVYAANIGENGYDTLGEALEAAQDGDVIVLKAHTFDEEVVISKSVTIQGPNVGIAGNAQRKAEAVITKALVVDAANVTIDGVKFEQAATITFKKDNFALKNCIQVSTSYATVGTTNRKAQLVDGADTSGLLVSGCYFVVNSNYCKGPIGTGYKLSNATITNNVIESSYASGDINEAIQLYVIGGDIVISKNTIKFDTTNFLIYMGANGNYATSVTIIDNYMSGNKGGNTSGLSVRNMPTGCVYTIEHNYIYQMTGNLIDSKTSAAGTKVIIKYNYFDTAFKFTNVGNAAVTYEGNCYKVAQTTATSDVQTYADYDEEAMEAAYLESLAPTQKITWNLDGGEWVGEEGVAKFEEGQAVVLPACQKVGYKFLGWFENDVLVTEISEFRDYNLVAKYEESNEPTWTKLGILYVNPQESGAYPTIDAALADAVDGSVIVLAPGEYTLTSAITKAVKIVGPNAGIHGHSSERGAEAKITVHNLSLGKYVEFDGVHLYGGSDQKNVCVTTSSVKDIIFNNSIIEFFNSVIRYDANVKADATLTFKNCAIIKVTQFLVKGDNIANVKNINVINNYITNCGSTSNSGSGLIRLITTGGASTVECLVAGNTFDGECVASVNTYFRCQNGHMTITNNKFMNVTRLFANTNVAANVTMDNNLYLDASGAVLATKPDGALDTTTQTSVEEFVGYNATPAQITYNARFAVACEEAVKQADGIGPVLLPLAKLEGFVFLGWCQEEDLSDTPVMMLASLNANVTLYAKFEAIPEHTLTFNANGGEMVGTPAVTTALEGSTIEWTVTAQRAEYFFLGWFDNPECTGNPITSIVMTSDKVVYAGWKAYEYVDINFELDGGTLNDGAPTKYAKEVGVTLGAATKEGFTFVGWYLEPTFETKVTAISKDETEEVTLYALWQVNGSFDVTYVLNGGNNIYSSRSEMVNDFIADFSKDLKKASLGKFFDESYGIVYADVVNWFTTGKGHAKWGWLYDYILLVEETHDAASFASEVAQVRGNLHNFLNANGSSIYGCDFTDFALAEGFWGYIQQESLSLTAQTQFIEVSYPWHTFLGWYDNPEFSGNALKTLPASGTYYAKWEEKQLKVEYILNNEEATIEEDVTYFTAADAFSLQTPSYSLKKWIFDGWFLNPEFTQGISEVKQYSTESIKVYAKWTECEGMTVTYELNGGLFVEPTDALYNQIIAEFKADYAKYCTSAFSVWNGENATANAQLLKVFTETNHKWDWLLDYWMAYNNNSYSGTTNADAFRQVKEKGSVPNGYFLWVELNGWYSNEQKSVYSGGLKSCTYENPETRNGIWAFYTQAQNNVVINVKDGATLPQAYKYLYNFAGWYKDAQCLTPVTVASEADTDDNNRVTYYAKWVEGTPVTDITLGNAPTQMAIYDTLQLTWTIVPADANFKGVTFRSSDSSVVAVSSTGLLTAVASGTATIYVKTQSASGVEKQFTVTVIVPGHFEVSYETESYGYAGETLQLNAQYIQQNGTLASVSFESLNETIATVNDNVVTLVAPGVATIRCTVVGDSSKYIDFVVTCLPEGLSEGALAAVANNNSNIFYHYNLGIGAGTPAYYMDIIGSVSDVIYNEEFVIDRRYEATQAGISSNHGGKMSSIEFITVHYTGNMAKGATANANAEYFAGGGGGTSIHYVTGNDGIFSCLDDSLVGFHAGDGTDTTFTWKNTGVAYEEGDPTYPVWGITGDSYFTINGKKTAIAVPKGSTPLTEHVTDKRFINDMGLPFKVENGVYYMGTTYWCYSQVAEGRICSHGGNNNSIGIESAVDLGSDLWYTWHKTARLVAKLMHDNNLDITRVVGHHFFSAKDCPQPLLENDLEIWWIFKDMVEAEYEKMYTLSNYYYELAAVGTQPAMNSYGRISLQNDAQIVTYKVTVVNTTTGATEEVTLACAVNGIYSR